MHSIFIGSLTNRPEPLEPLEPNPATPSLSGDCVVPVLVPVPRETGTTLEPTRSAESSPSALFVSTGLKSWSTDQPRAYARDVQINDTAYRRLDPEYYAWLRSKMNLAKMAAGAGQLGRDEFDELRPRFNAMHGWAIAHFGERALVDAIHNLDARVYPPPVAETDNPRRTRRTADVAMENVRGMVDAIAEKATSLGWKRESLYRTSRSAFGFNCGLMYFLKPSDRIGEVTTPWIEILRLGSVRHRFYNPDVDQPWVIRIDRKIK